MSIEQLQELSESEFDILKTFVKSGTGIPELLRRFIAIKIIELDSLQDIDLSNPNALSHVFGKREACDKLIEIFDSLDLGALGELIHKRGTKPRSFR